MAVKVAINGFGRIGRLVFRAIAEQGMIGKDVDIVAVGDIVPADNLAYLLKYDSTQGRFNGTADSKKPAADKNNPKAAYGHITAGAKKVIISAPAKNEDITLVMGVNNDKYDPKRHHI